MRRFWNVNNGRFNVNANYNPDNRKLKGDFDFLISLIDDVGLLFASRSASGASHASQDEQVVLGSGSPIEVVSEAEYQTRIRDLEAQNKALRAKADFVDGLAEQLKPLLGKA